MDSKKTGKKIETRGRKPKIHVAPVIPPKIFDQSIDDYLLRAVSRDGCNFKVLIDTLKSTLTEVSLTFSNEGIKMTAVDTNGSSVVYITILQSSFEEYFCERPLKIGIDIEKLHKTLKTSKSNNDMTWIISKKRPDYIEIMFRNYIKGTETTDLIKLLDLEESELIDELSYPKMVEVDSQMMQSICREMASIKATMIKISRKNKNLVFENMNGNVFRKVSLELDVRSVDDVDDDDDDDTEGVFLLKPLKSFSKAASLTPKVKIYLRKNELDEDGLKMKRFPFVCEYDISGFGVLRYILGQQNPDTM